MKDLEIEDQLYEIESELRELDQIPDKSSDDMARYAKLLDEKLLTVDLRDGLVDKADEEKRREEDEDLGQSQMMASVFGGSDRRRPSSFTDGPQQPSAVSGEKKKKKKSWLWFGWR